eukprot:scaffold129992_cov79-Cyclotella_meneghiniana.AAC.1
MVILHSAQHQQAIKLSNTGVLSVPSLNQLITAATNIFITRQRISPSRNIYSSHPSDEKRV